MEDDNIWQKSIPIYGRKHLILIKKLQLGPKPFNSGNSKVDVFMS